VLKTTSLRAVQGLHHTSWPSDSGLALSSLGCAPQWTQGQGSSDSGNFSKVPAQKGEAKRIRVPFKED
jgi:hypothetical protein